MGLLTVTDFQDQQRDHSHPRCMDIPSYEIFSSVSDQELSFNEEIVMKGQSYVLGAASSVHHAHICCLV